MVPSLVTNSRFVLCVMTIPEVCFLQHVLRELPSSPVPASCCTALLEAYSKLFYAIEMFVPNPQSNVLAYHAKILFAFLAFSITWFLYGCLQKLIARSYGWMQCKLLYKKHFLNPIGASYRGMHLPTFTHTSNVRIFRQFNWWGSIFALQCSLRPKPNQDKLQSTVWWFYETKLKCISTKTIQTANAKIIIINKENLVTL